MTTEIKNLHFKVDAKGVVELCRQTWLYEDRERWAIETIGYLAYGIQMDKIIDILNGKATLINKGDDECVLVEEVNEAWVKEIKEHRDFIENKYLVFAGRKVTKDTVNQYADNIVSRLRNAIRTPGFLASADPVEIMKLEDARQEMHEAIMIEAGFPQHDIDLFFRHHGGSDEITEFAYQLSIYVDNRANL
jgi:hypothetical protein